MGTATIGTTSTSWQPRIESSGYIMSSFKPNWSGPKDPGRNRAYYQVIKQEVNLRGGNSVDGFTTISGVRVVAGSSFGDYSKADAFVGNVSGSSFSKYEENVNYIVADDIRYYAGARTTDTDGMTSTRTSPGSSSGFTVEVNGGSGPIQSSNSQQYVKFTFYTLPSEPRSLSLSDVSATSIKLSWSVPTNQGGEGQTVSRYRIQRKEGTGSFVDYATSTTTSYTDTGVSAFTTYGYRVSAENGIQDENNFSPSLRGPYSNTASDTTGSAVDPPSWSRTFANGRVGVSYYDTVFANDADNIFTRAGNDNIPGLSTDTTNFSTGIRYELYGSPTQSGTYDIRLEASNENPTSVDFNDSITIFAPFSPSFSATSFKDGKEDAAYGTSTITVSNATSVSSNVSTIAGLSVSTSSTAVTLSNTPNASGTFSFSVTATGYSDGGTANTTTQTLSVTIDPLEPPVWSDTSLSNDFRVGQEYSTTSNGNNSISASNSATFSVISGSLPAGISDTRTLSGTTAIWTLTGEPTTRGAYSFSVRATNNDGTASPDQTFNGNVTHPPLFTDNTLSDFEQGRSYGDSLSVSTSTSVSWSVSSGSLPSGVTLSAGGTDNSVLTFGGAPDGTGSFSFTITASNSDGSISESFTGTILEVPNWIDNEIGSFVENIFFQDFVEATNNPSYNVVSGSLPTGISLDSSTGEISGTPTTVGETFDFTIRASNADGFIDQNFQGEVQPDLGGGVKVYDGSAWVNREIYVYDGNTWAESKLHIYNGNIWVKSLF